MLTKEAKAARQKIAAAKYKINKPDNVKASVKKWAQENRLKLNKQRVLARTLKRNGTIGVKCPECKEKYEKKRAGQVFCNVKCKDKNYKRRKKLERSGTPVMRPSSPKPLTHEVELTVYEKRVKFNPLWSAYERNQSRI